MLGPRDILMRSFDRPKDTEIPPSDWVLRFADLVKADGRHSELFLSKGFAVTAVDIDVSDLIDNTATSFEVVQCDLETESWPFRSNYFDGIVVSNYLHRPLFPNLIASLAPNGVLIMETFAVGNEKLGRPSNPSFLLERGELLNAFSADLQIIAYEHGIIQTEAGLRVKQRICASNTLQTSSRSDKNPDPHYLFPE